MVSPSCRSLKEPSPIPHSYPSRTSVTSSLKRRSDSTVRLSPTTTPSRKTRALELRRISPERTIEPAMLPNFEERKTSRISDRKSTRLNSSHVAISHGIDDFYPLSLQDALPIYTALVSLANLSDVVLKATERFNREVVTNHNALTQNARLGVAADFARAHDRTRDVAELRRAEDLADFRGTGLHLFIFRLEHALKGCFNILDRLVDDRVVADVDAFAIGQFVDPLGGTHVKADDDGVVDRGEVDVVLRDRTDTAVDDAQIDFFAHIDLQQGVFKRFNGTRNIALQNEVESLDLALLQRLGEVFQADALATTCQCRGPFGRFTTLSDLARSAVVRGHQEGVTRVWYRGHTQYLDGAGWARFIDRVAVFIEHGTHAAEGRAGDDGFTHVQGSRLDEHRNNGTAALIEIRFDRNTARIAVRVGCELKGCIGRQQHGFQQFVDTDGLQRRDVNEHRLTAIFLSHEVVLS